MSNKKRIVIAVSGLNNIDSPGPGVPVIRSLRESKEFDVRIIGLAYETLEPGIYLPDLLDCVYLVPYPSQGIEAVYFRLMQIHEKEGIQVLIPNFDSELIPMIKLEERLKSHGIHMLIPTIENFEERHKNALPEFGKKYGINVPRSYPVSSMGDIYAVMRILSYPVMVKGNMYDAYKAENQDEAMAHFIRISQKWGLPVIFQEYVKGTEVNVVALGDGHGNTIGAVPMRKQYITDKGKAWGGITISNNEMLKLTDHIISSMRWRGGMELELIRTSDNKLYVIEINPRIPAWVYLAVGAGQNIPEALVRLALGEEVTPMREFRVSTVFIRYSWDMIADWNEYQKFTTSGYLSKE